jgi:NAD(P)H-flavin reductase
VIAISDDVRWKGPRGLLGNVVANAGDWSSHDVLVCGSPAMVKFTVAKLIGAGVPENQIKFEDFGDA